MRAFAAALTAVSLLGSASLAAAEQPLDEAVRSLAHDDARVAAVAFRLATANVDLCDDKAPLLGFTVHSARQYGLRLRPTARRVFALDDRPQVQAVAPGGPADRAGLRTGDILETINDQPTPTPGPGDDQAPPSYAQVERTLRQLTSAATLGPVRLMIQRAGQSLAIAVATTPGCAYDTQLIASETRNASADGDHVFITTALASYAASDDDLALVLGHELAHDVLHHRQKLDKDGFARKVLGNLGTPPARLVRFEREADYVGLYLTARAGFDISRADDFWLRYADAHGDAWYAHWGHPSARDRAHSLALTRDEILGKRSAHLPLLPEPVGSQ